MASTDAKQRQGWLAVPGDCAGGQVSSDAPLELVSRLSDVSVHEAGAIAWHMPFDDDQYHRLLIGGGTVGELEQNHAETAFKRARSRIIRADYGGNIPHIERCNQ